VYTAALLIGASGCGRHESPARAAAVAVPSASAVAVDPAASSSTATRRRLPDGCASPITLEVVGRAGQNDLYSVEGSEAYEYWRGDLNGDELADRLLLIKDTCGNWGECERVAVLSCGGNRFAKLYGPEYCVDLRPGPRVTDGFRDLVETRRHGGHDQPGTTAVTLRFRDGRYASDEP
jgi:hypothetical protein